MPTPKSRSWPCFRQRSVELADPLAHRRRPSAPRARRGPAHGTGSLKKIIMPSPAKRSSVPSCARISSPIAAWYSRSTRHHLLGLGGLGEGGEAAQVAEDDRDLAPMASRSGSSAPAGDDQLGELRREEALEAAEPLELGSPARRRAARASGSTPRARPPAPRARPCSCTVSWSALMRSIDFTRATSAAWSTGFVRYSSAPASRPATMSFGSPLAVTRMIGMNGRAASRVQPPADLDAVELRHHDVEQDQVGLASRRATPAPPRRRRPSRSRSRGPRGASGGCRRSSGCRRRSGSRGRRPHAQVLADLREQRARAEGLGDVGVAAGRARLLRRRRSARRR